MCCVSLSLERTKWKCALFLDSSSVASQSRLQVTIFSLYASTVFIIFFISLYIFLLFSLYASTFFYYFLYVLLYFSIIFFVYFYSFYYFLYLYFHFFYYFLHILLYSSIRRPSFVYTCNSSSFVYNGNSCSNSILSS